MPPRSRLRPRRAAPTAAAGARSRLCSARSRPLIVGAVVVLGGSGGGEEKQAQPRQTGKAAARLEAQSGGEGTGSDRPDRAKPEETKRSLRKWPRPRSGGKLGIGGAALNEQGYALIQAGEYDAAVPVLEEAVASFPEGTEDLDYAYALFNLGDALRLSGRPEEAIPVLERRLEIPNQTATVERELEARPKPAVRSARGRGSARFTGAGARSDSSVRDGSRLAAI